MLTPEADYDSWICYSKADTDFTNVPAFLQSSKLKFFLTVMFIKGAVIIYKIYSSLILFEAIPKYLATYLASYPEEMSIIILSILTEEITFTNVDQQALFSTLKKL